MYSLPSGSSHYNKENNIVFVLERFSLGTEFELEQSKYLINFVWSAAGVINPG